MIFYFEIKAIGQTELNASNPEEVLQLAAQRRKKKFLQAMAKLYFQTSDKNSYVMMQTGKYFTLFNSCVEYLKLLYNIYLQVYGVVFLKIHEIITIKPIILQNCTGLTY